MQNSVSAVRLLTAGPIVLLSKEHSNDRRMTWEEDFGLPFTFVEDINIVVFATRLGGFYLVFNKLNKWFLDWRVRLKSGYSRCILCANETIGEVVCQEKNPLGVAEALKEVIGAEQHVWKDLWERCGSSEGCLLSPRRTKILGAGRQG